MRVDVQPHEAGEEIEARIDVRLFLPFSESDAIRGKSGNYIGIGIREVTIRIRVQERVERSFRRSCHLNK